MSFFDAGGLIGHITDGYQSVIIKDCFVKANIILGIITSKRTIGGLIGAAHSDVTLIRCVSASDIPLTSTDMGYLIGYLNTNKTAKTISTYTTRGTTSQMKGSSSGTLSLLGGSGLASSWGDVEYEYSRLERKNDDGSTKGTTERGNERWGKVAGGYPKLTSTNYAVRLTMGANISSISGDGYSPGTYRYRSAGEQATVYSTLNPTNYQRIEYTFSSNYNHSSGSANNFSAVVSDSNWLLTPRVDGTVSAKIVNIPYPQNLTAVFDQWSSKVTLSGTYNNPEGLTGKLYFYKRAGGSGGWARETDGIDIISGSDKSFGKEITLAATDLEKNWEYYVVFIEGTNTVPTDPTLNTYQYVRALSSVSTATALNLSDFIVESGENNVTVKFKADNRLINSSAYKYTIQSSLNGGAFTNWVSDQSFAGKSDYYTHMDNRMSSSCDVYTYRLVVSAFNRTFTSADKSGSKTGATKFDDTVPFKATKGEHANYVRLSWKVKKDEAGSSETYRVFRRVANTDAAFVELETVTSASPTVYWNDNNALTGVFYEYQVRLYQVCSGNEAFSAERNDIGFTQAFGTVSGRATYGTGSAVPDVNMLVRRNELQEGESQYRSLKSTGGGQSFEWKTTAAVFNPIWTSKQWTLQFWINPNVTNTGSGKIIGYIGGSPINLNKVTGGYQVYWQNAALISEIIPADRFSHISIVRDGNTMKLYTVNDQKPDSIFIKNSSYAYSTATDQSEANSRISLGHTLSGNIDDIRFWKRTLSETEILRDYSRYIVGNENKLVGYWTLDEGLAGYAFDRSRVGTVYNGNHATTNTLASDVTIPNDIYQLALKGITDKDGNYQISGIPYSGEGTSYSVVPSLGVHVFNPTQQLRYISPTSMVHNATDFTDISSFSVKGKVVYEGGTYPVEGCTFIIDGQPVTKSGQLIKSDSQGEFEISVPIGIHEVKVQKQGHTFAGNGLLLDNGNNLNYNKNITSIKFYDQTKVKLTGRITGGLEENNKPLGFGESKNNIGAGKLTLNSTRPQYKFAEAEKTESFNHNNGEWKKPNGLTQDITVVKYKENGVEITVSPKTGEFVAWVYPEPYNIGEIKIPGANSTQQTIYSNNEILDLTSAAVPDNSYMKTSVRTWKDSVFVSKPGMVDHYETVEKSDTVRYHAEWKYYYQATPTFSVTQVVGSDEVNYFGDKDITLNNELTGTSETVNLWNGSVYLFDAPVFSQGKNYTFAFQAYEQYVNYTATPADTVTYPVSGGMVDLANNIRLNPEPEQIALDSLGKALYTFSAGAPDLTTGKNSFFATVQVGNSSYYWNLGQTPVEAWHLGDRSSGTDFMTSGPDELTTILRDPPGSNSFAYIEKGTTITSSVTNSLVDGMVETMNLTISLGPKITTFIGLGGGVITEAETVIDISAGLTAEQTWNKETEKSTTTTFTERFETSTDPLYVGHLGDVFIGNSTNIQYGLTNGINIQKGTIAGNLINKNEYSIAPSVGLAYGQSFATRFAFTQVELEEIMIPKWEQSIKLRLLPVGTTPNVSTITAPQYVSKLTPDHVNYGKPNIDKKAFPNSDLKKPYDGESYKIYFPATWTAQSNEMKEFQDSIIWANNQISQWTSVLKQNEKEKVEMKQLGNYSFGAGATIEQSKTTSVSSSFSNSFTWVLNPSIGLETGGEVMGIGLNLKVDMEYRHENTTTQSGSEESSMNVGFVLAEEGDDDQITVDYGMTKSGTIAFKSRGGRTSCPYEGEVKSKYYEPGRHILSEATMQIEVPKIDVSSASAVLNVPANKTASFVLDMKNESETEEDVWFQLIVDEETNPDGAELKIDGGIIGNGRMFLVKAGEVLKKTLTVGKGTADSYKNIGLILRSQCQHDPTDFLPDIADTTYVSVEFVPACSDVRIKEPTKDWIVNSNHATADTLYVTIDNFDVNYPNFGYVRLEYRETTSPSWSTITTFYPSSLYAGAQGVKEDIGTRSALVYPWKMPNIDGAYELRAMTASVNSSGGKIIGNPISTYTTDAIAGYKDITRPTALGLPSPASGILGAGDELSITFNEDIQTGMLTKDNFSISGVLNAQKIAEPNVGLAFTGSQSAQTELPVYTNGSFSIETWFKRNANTAGTLFAYGQGNNYISLGFNTTGNAVLKIGTETYTSVDAVANDDTWKHIAMAYNRDNNTVSVYEFEGASSKTLFTGKQLTAKPETQGKLYVGNNAASTDGFKGSLAQLHFYNVKRGQADVSADMSTTKSGREYGLIGYWNMEEGNGNVATDKARARNLIVSNNWYIYPSGNAKQTNGNSTYFSIPTATYPLNVFSDFTLEFWFRSADANQADKVLFSADNGFIGTNGNKELVLYKADGSVNQVLTTANLVDSEWHHVALSVKRNGNVNTYIDGVSRAVFNETALGSFASGNYYFGAKRASNNTYSKYFNGYFDEIRIWNSALNRESILLNKNNKLSGNEAGLQAYYPFETYTKQSSGLITVTTSDKNVVDNNTVSGTAVTSATAKAVKDVPTREDVPFTYVASNNKVVFTLDSKYFSRVEGTTLSISAKDIRDMRDNKSNAENWITYVNRNALLWDSESVNLIKEEGENLSFSAKIVNKGASTVSYVVENLPSWLSVSSSTGNLQPLASKELTFTVFKGINTGSYETAIGLSGGNGVVEVLPVQLRVTGQHPDWSVNPHDYESTMTVTGRISIEGVFQDDSDDLLAAFIGDECVGLTSPVYVENQNSCMTFLTVYGNSVHVGKTVDFKLWDASTGYIHSVLEYKKEGVNSTLTFNVSKTEGTPASPIIHNALSLIEQSIALSTGWSWISVNVDNANPSLIDQFKDRMSPSGTILKGQTEYIQNPNWVGNLTSVKNESMYIVHTNAAHTLHFDGKAANTAATPIAITNGWNWIGYVPQFTLPVNEALAGLNPQINDQIKSHNAYRIYAGAAGWIGNLDYMRAGEGYMYKSGNTAAQSLTYPSQSSQAYKSPMMRSMAADEEKHWTVDYQRFPDNMTLTSSVLLDGQVLNSSGIEIGAFHGDECRGSILLKNYPELTEYPYLGFLMVYGDPNDEITLKVYDHAANKEYPAINSPVTFAANGVHGNPLNPYQIKISALTDSDNNTKDVSIRLYPNPVETNLNIARPWSVVDLVEITDLSGRIIMQERDFSNSFINVSELEDGLYILKLTHKDVVKSIKFTKK